MCIKSSYICCFFPIFLHVIVHYTLCEIMLNAHEKGPWQPPEYLKRSDYCIIYKFMKNLFSQTQCKQS